MGVNTGGIDSLSGRILLTLHLADRRGYGLSLSHLSKTLVLGPVPEAVISRELSSMKGISSSGKVYCLEGSEHLLQKTSRRLVSNGLVGAKYKAEAYRFASEFASLCPFVRCIAIAGSVASEGFSEEDDIDFNLFVESGRKYTSYLLGILLSIKYSFRHRGKPLASCSATPFLPKLACINVIWEEHQALPFSRQDAYLAYELMRQKPVFGLEFYGRVLSNNAWLGSFFPQINGLDQRELEAKSSCSSRLLRFFYSHGFLAGAGEWAARQVCYLTWRLVQFSRRNNPEAIERARWVNSMQSPYCLFGDVQ